MRQFPSAPHGIGFPETSWDLVRRCRDGAPAEKKLALDRLLVLYWKPVYRFFQRALGLHGEELKDVTQAFFARFLEKDFLRNLREEKSFRGFIKTACRRFLINHREKVRVREGSRKHVTLEDGSTEAQGEDALGTAIDAEFRAFYIEEALELAAVELRRRKKEVYLEVLRARMTPDEPPEYEEIALRLGLSLYDVRNYLHAARKVFKKMLVKIAEARSRDPEWELRALGLEVAPDTP